MKEEDLNRIVLAYLKKKGYRNAEAAFQADSKTQSFQEMVYGQGNDLDVSILNQVYLFNKGENVPSRYGESYGKLLAWVHNSLDLYKNELSRILYPIFVHCFLQLVAKGYPTEARDFFQAFKADHQSAHGRDLQKLEGVSNPQHLLDNDLAKSYRENKISVKLCQYSCELLISFLHDSEMMLMLSLVNEHLNLEVVPGQPSPLPEEDEAFTVTGKLQEALENLNRSEIRWGQLEDGIEHRFEEKLAEEAAEGANEEKKDGDPSKPPSKKLKKDGKAGGAGKAGKQGAKAVASNVTRVPSVIPLPRLSEEVEGLAFEDLRKRVQLSSAALPSVCFYTFMNHYNSLNTVALSSDGSKVAAGFSDSSVKVWDMSKRTVSQPQEQYAEMRTSEGAGPGPGSQSQAASTPGSMGYSLLQAHSGPVYGADFSPDVQFLLSSSADTTVRLWSMELGANLVCYKGHNYPVWDVRFSPLGHYFATASHDRTARVWATDRIHPLRIMAGHLSDVDCVRWHPNCNYIATGSSDKTVRLWDVATGECMRIFTGHRSTVLSLAMSPDGRHMASADEDGTIMVWDLGSGRKVVTPLLGRNGCVWSLAFSSEGSLLASGSEDNTVRIWDVGASTRTSKGDDKPGSARRLRLVKTLPTKNTPVYCLQFSPRNLLFAAGAAQRPKNEARK